MSNSIKRKIKRRLKQFKHTVHLEPCKICGHSPTPLKPNTTGAFIIDPDKVHRFGGIPGRPRVIGYSLCASCMRLPDKVQRVEDIIEAEVNKRVAQIPADAVHQLKCISCGGTGDMLHVGNMGYTTCKKCRDTVDNLGEIAAKQEAIVLAEAQGCSSHGQ